MAKEDFCFTYYDGDAARDKAHMTRLQRGAYDDIISAQRKRGHLSLEDIKRVLSKDFEECWTAIEWVLLKDEEDKFFIEWVEKSISEMKKNSKRNKEQLDKYWAEVKAGIRPAPKNGKKKYGSNTEVIPTYLSGIKNEIPLIDGNEDGNEDGIKEEGGEWETETPVVLMNENLVPSMLSIFKEINHRYPEDKSTDYPALRELSEKISKWDNLPGAYTDLQNADAIKHRWGELCRHIASDSFLSKYSISQINKYFSSITQSLTNAARTNKNGGSGFQPQGTGGY
jgi:hypothetical protein